MNRRHEERMIIILFCRPGERDFCAVLSFT